MHFLFLSFFSSFQFLFIFFFPLSILPFFLSFLPFSLFISFFPSFPDLQKYPWERLPMLTRRYKSDTRWNTTIGCVWWMKHDASTSPQTAHVRRGNGTWSRHMCALLVYSLTSSGNTGISRALFARTHAHVHVRTLSGRTASWFPQQQASTCLLTLLPRPPLPSSLQTYSYLYATSSHRSSSFPTLPRKESIETQSVFLMSAPTRRSLAAAASLISSAATCAEAFYCI